MRITEQPTDAAHVLAVTGHLDSNTSQALEDVLLARMLAEPAVIVDLKDVQYVSSAGLRVLLRAAKIARGNTHRLVLASLASQVQDVFDISGFSRIFDIQPDLATALSSLA